MSTAPLLPPVITNTKGEANVLESRNRPCWNGSSLARQQQARRFFLRCRKYIFLVPDTGRTLFSTPNDRQLRTYRIELVTLNLAKAILLGIGALFVVERTRLEKRSHTLVRN